MVVDGSQGVEAQTLANCYTAVEEGLEVVPVINKIDLPQAEPERVKLEIEEMVGINASEAPLVSAKTGVGIDDLLEKLVDEIPGCLLYTSPSPRDLSTSRMPSSA